MKAKRSVRKNPPSRSLTLRQIIAQLKKHQDLLQKEFSVRKIGIFGSYAAGRQTKKSDVDFIVEFDDPTFDHFMGLIAFLEKLFEKRVDVLTPQGVESIRLRSVAEEIRQSAVYV